MWLLGAQFVMLGPLIVAGIKIHQQRKEVGASGGDAFECTVVFNSGKRFCSEYGCSHRFRVKYRLDRIIYSQMLLDGFDGLSVHDYARDSTHTCWGTPEKYMVLVKRDQVGTGWWALVIFSVLPMVCMCLWGSSIACVRGIDIASHWSCTCTVCDFVDDSSCCNSICHPQHDTPDEQITRLQALYAERGFVMQVPGDTTTPAMIK